MKLDDKTESRATGFTIVELLVVIVVIGILAAITIVSYTGITQKAAVATLKSDLKNSSTLLGIDSVNSGTFPPDVDSANDGKGLPKSPNTNYSYTTTGTTYCISATSTTTGYVYHVSSDNGSIEEGACPGPVTFVTAWGGANLDRGNSLIKTSDGGYVVSGITESYGSGDADMFIAKYTSNSDLSWSRVWGGTDLDEGNSLIQTDDGGYVITGYTYSYSSGNADMFLTKYNSEGSLLWSKTWGGAGDDYGQSIIQTSDGGLAIEGYTEVFGAGSSDVFLAIYTSDGNLSWSRTWGGIDMDDGQSLVQTSDDGYVIVGNTYSYGAGSSDMFLTKYSSSGDLLWSRTWGGINYEDGRSLIQTSDDGFAVTGYTSSYGAGGVDIILAKYTSDGNLAWSRTWGGTGDDYGLSLIQTSDGGLVITGYTPSYGAGFADMLLAKYTSDGNLAWSRTWGGTSNDYGKSIIQTSDGGLAVTGYTNSYVTTFYDMFIAKYTSDGTITNCSSPMCQSPSATVTSPSPTVTSPTATVTTPSPTVTSPSPTVTSPTPTTTVIVAP